MYVSSRLSTVSGNKINTFTVRGEDSDLVETKINVQRIVTGIS